MSRIVYEFSCKAGRQIDRVGDDRGASIAFLLQYLLRLVAFPHTKQVRPHLGWFAGCKMVVDGFVPFGLGFG